jgi:hypothetical protein
MKKTNWSVCAATILLSLLCVLVDNPVAETAKPVRGGAVKQTKSLCNTCHTDLSAVVPQGHPAVKGNALTLCITCHVPDMTGEAKKNGFSSRMHKAHIPPKGTLECTSCHSWVPGKNFGLLGHKGSWGSPKKDDMALMKKMFASWANSTFTDNLHAKVDIACAQCHGKGLPRLDSTVENSRCLACHGPMDNLAAKTEPRDFKDRNPHKSHLGEINCTVCHHAHAESKAFCLDCHKNFKMRIQGTLGQ